MEVFKSDGITRVLADDVLTLTELQGLHYRTIAQANGSAPLSWRVQDNGGTENNGQSELAESLVITVTAVNDTPLVVELSKIGTEDTLIAFAAGDFTDAFTDVDGDALALVRITSLPEHGQLLLGACRWA